MNKEHKSLAYNIEWWAYFKNKENMTHNSRSNYSFNNWAKLYAWAYD